MAGAQGPGAISCDQRHPLGQVKAEGTRARQAMLRHVGRRSETAGRRGPVRPRRNTHAERGQALRPAVVRGEHPDPTRTHRDGVLPVRSARRVDGDHRPVVLEQLGHPRTSGEHRLDRDAQPGPQPRALLARAVVEDLGRLVHRGTDAVPHVLLHDAVRRAGRCHHFLHRVTDSAETVAPCQGGDAGPQCPLGHVHQCQVLGVGVRQHGAEGRVTVLPDADPEDLALVDVTERALWAGIVALAKGDRLSGVGDAVEAVVAASGTPYGIVQEYVGHGIGTAMHQPPEVLNYRTHEKGTRLRPGLCVAIEPMLTRGSRMTQVLEDDWTVVTVDASRAAHWEHTVAMCPGGVWVLTAHDGGAERLAALGVSVAPWTDGASSSGGFAATPNVP